MKAGESTDFEQHWINSEMLALKKFDAIVQKGEGQYINGEYNGTESPLEIGAFSGTLIGGSKPFKTVTPKTEKGNWVLTIAKVKLVVGDKIVSTDGTINIDEWRDDILAGIQFSGQNVSVECRLINGKRRNHISRA